MILLVLVIIIMTIEALYALWLTVAVMAEIIKERHDESGSDSRIKDDDEQVQR